MLFQAPHERYSTERQEAIAVGGFLLALVCTGGMIAEFRDRGLWGLVVTGWAEFLVGLGLIGLAAWLCWWAFQYAAGWSRWLALAGTVIAAAGIVMSLVLVIVVLLVALAALWRDNADAFVRDDSSSRRKKRPRRRRRRSW